MNNLEWIFNSGDIINYSYSVSNFEGKAIELSYFIEDKLMLEVKEYPLVQNNYYKQEYDISISKEYIDNNIVEDGKIIMTAYKLENYLSCPFGFFFKDILKLRTSDEYKHLSKYVGTINHKLIETLYLNDKVNNSIDKETINDITSSMFDALRAILPNYKHQLRMIENNNLDNMVISVLNLAELDKKSDYKRKESEYKFELFTEEYETKLKIKGVIDRIDTSGFDFKVIDYKSNQKTLSIPDIARGKALQLLVYLYSYKCLSGFTPASMLYFFFNNKLEDKKKITIKNGDIFIKDLDERDNSNAKKEILINTNNPSITDGEKGKGQDYDTLIKYLFNAFNIYYHGIINSQFKILPHEDSCKYCDYSSICHGKYKARKYEDLLSRYDLTISEEITNEEK